MRSVGFIFVALASTALAQPSAIPQFEAVSIKPCGATPPPAGESGGRRGNVSRAASPDRLYLGCMTLRRLVIQAIMTYSAGHIDTPWNLRTTPFEVEGGPSWFDSDRYIIEATTDGKPTREMISGPMLQAVLEERFHLKTHREEREVPIYDLTVAPAGLKLQRPDDRSCTEPYAGGPAHDGREFLPLNCSKLQRAVEGACIPRVPGQPPSDEKPVCGLRGTFSPTRRVVDILGGTMAQIASAIANDGAGRPVVDETGITDKFDIHLEFAPYAAPPSDQPDGAPVVSSALAQLGLKLKPTKGTRSFLVIDHVERPSAN
jgi:uncharacterized protein (TIGR03435 family)